MNLGTLDLSMWPPALVWSLLVIVLVCHVLPDALKIAPGTKSSLPSSPSGPLPTGSPVQGKPSTP